MPKKVKGLSAACRPPGRDKPPRKKLAQRPSYPRGYATPMTVSTMSADDLRRIWPDDR